MEFLSINPQANSENPKTQKGKKSLKSTRRTAKLLKSIKEHVLFAYLNFISTQLLLSLTLLESYMYIIIYYNNKYGLDMPYKQ